MKKLRAVIRLSLAVLNSLFFATVLLVGKLFLFPFAKLDARWRMSIFRLWSRCQLLALGVRVEVEGTPPKAPFFLVSNHLSYIDIPVIGRYAGAIFIAKAEISRWPLVGFLCRSINTIFVDRGVRRDLPRVMQEIDSEMKNGMGVVLFAEGTSSKGATVLPFRPSLLEVAARSDIPVSYASLSYRTEGDDPPAHTAVCWWGGVPFSPHALECAGLGRIHAKVVFGDVRIHDTNRKRLANKLRAEILAIFEPVVEENAE